MRCLMAEEGLCLGARFHCPPATMTDYKEPTSPPPITDTVKENRQRQDELNLATRMDLERRALEMAVAGEVIDDIADEVGLSLHETKHLLSDALKALRAYNYANAASLRDIQHVRLEMSIRALWPKIEAGDIRAIDSLVRISKRISELWGLDAPTKMSLTDPSGKKLETLRLVFGAGAPEQS